jgi:hypothetical protein
MRLTLCLQVRDKMETAKRDTVDRVDKYTKKYKPTADKYNKLCVSTLVPFELHLSLVPSYRCRPEHHSCALQLMMPLSSPLLLALRQAAANQALAIWMSHMSGNDCSKLGLTLIDI